MSATPRRREPATACKLLGVVLLAGLAWEGSQARAVSEPAALPVTGRDAPGLEAFDRAMIEFMQARGIPAGALAVLKDGRLVLEHGYGHADHAGKLALPANAPFRLASLSKPITAAAIWKLIREGKLRLDTHLLDVLAVTPPAGQRRDRRWKDITIQHLLKHQGGWDRKAAFDPMFRALKIARALGKPGPAGAEDIIRYMAGEPLQFDPGTRTAYSNFGFILLGRVIERVSGRTYGDYVRQEILAPVGVRGVELGRTLPADRNPREPFYADPGKGRDVMHPASRQRVPTPDGTFYLEAMDANGGLIAPAADYARFLWAYGVNGRAAKKGGAGVFFGSLPGTFTMGLRRADGVVVVALFNQRTDPSDRDYHDIRPLLERTADGIRHWPGR
jgi:CubicO group peptidase (beta-lactamase class C family)